MRCRVLSSGGRMLWVEEMVLWGLSCSMWLRRSSSLGLSPSPPPPPPPPVLLPPSLPMKRLSFSRRSNRLMPLPRSRGFWVTCPLAVAESWRAFSHARVASRNSTAFLGSSTFNDTSSLSSIRKSLCGWREWDRHVHHMEEYTGGEYTVVYLTYLESINKYILESKDFFTV